MTLDRLVFAAAFLWTIFLHTNIVQASPPEKFIFPVDCIIGQTCWITNLVDVDPSENAKDFQCKNRTYDGHKGTDFALKNTDEINKNISVLAAAKGTVLRIRDREIDSLKSEEEFEEIKEDQKECGNGVLIDHGQGLRTMYCHIKKDSIIVRPNDTVTAGQKIGEIGQSGFSEFPHLHFGILWEGGIVDPFSGGLNTEGCGTQKKTLWADPQSIQVPQTAQIYDAGFYSDVPDFDTVKSKGLDTASAAISPGAPALVFWAALYNASYGEKVTLTILSPDGSVFTKREITQDKDRARQFYYTGRKASAKPFPSGIYKGIITVTNDAGIKSKQEKLLTIQ